MLVVKRLAMSLIHEQVLAAVGMNYLDNQIIFFQFLDININFIFFLLETQTSETHLFYLTILKLRVYIHMVLSTLV